MRYLDPTAVTLGVVAVAASLVLGVAAVPAVAIGGVTFTVASSGTFLRTRREHRAITTLPEGPATVRLHPEEERWVSRGGDAVAAIRLSVRSLARGPLRDRLGRVADDAQSILGDLRMLAAQVASIRDASQALDASGLATDLSRLTSTLEQNVDADVEEDVRRSVDAVRGQLMITRRLDAARSILQARIESGAFGLQRLAAQVGEMTVLATPDAPSLGGGRIDELTAGLEALRDGLSDAGALSRRALGALDDEGGHDVPVVP